MKIKESEFNVFNIMIIYFVILMVIPMWAQHKVKSNYEKYSQVRSTSGKTGREVLKKFYILMAFTMLTSLKAKAS